MADKLTITIDMDNAAFDDNREDEVCRLLEWIIKNPSLAEMLLHGGRMRLTDINGNPVGKAEALAY